MTRSDIHGLEDARAFIAATADATGGLDVELLVTLDERLHAALYDLIIIGETLGRVTPTVKGLAPTIRWRSITGLRNILVHAYWQTDPKVVVRVVLEELPVLGRQLAKLIGQLKASDP